MQGLIDEKKNLIDMSSASLLLNTDAKTAETAFLQDLPLHQIASDLQVAEFIWKRMAVLPMVR